ncbi:MAG TPA: phosphonate C-P lyase system protein PhnL [Ramlibacter sp.]|uniref:phosphonate C-P lyase system protein PhnL n=1 Tax=Ramlibacter sp. TaxID=1917967 RepID=UPI002ED603D0
MTILLRARGLAKTFTLHARDGLRLPVFEGVDLQVAAGECLALTGRSGTGKSSLLRCLYGNYAASAGEIVLLHEGREVDMSAAEPPEVIEVRRRTLGYVSQFLRVVPRVPALDVVAQPLRQLGVDLESARRSAAGWLARLNVPERLWQLPPATFSGGEQQRVNIAHGLIAGHPILLLDEPTASLDAANRAVVVSLVREACARGTAVVGIFHDEEVRDAVASRCLDLESFRTPSLEPA